MDSDACRVIKGGRRPTHHPHRTRGRNIPSRCCEEPHGRLTSVEVRDGPGDIRRPHQRRARTYTRMSSSNACPGVLTVAGTWSSVEESGSRIARSDAFLSSFARSSVVSVQDNPLEALVARNPARPHPPVPLREALDVARTITEFNAGRPMNRILLAEAMRASPTSSGFRDRIMASYRYGLTSGNYKSESIALTPTGEAATKPRNDNERVSAEREAFANVPIFGQLMDHYSNARLPDAVFLKNTVERPPFNIDPAWSAEVAELFVSNARDVGYVRDMNGASYIVVDAGTALIDLDEPAEDFAVTEPKNLRSEPELVPIAHIEHQSPPERAKPVQVFVAHGRSTKPLEQLKRILNEWQVPFVVAVDEAHAGRPISEKVADLMKACSAGIFIFSADEQFTDDEGTTIFRPSQNVVYELGAAGLLYGRKIVVFRESTVTFPSDFSDLGWITFEKDALDAKAMDLLRELIALKAVKLVSSAGE